MPYAFTLTTTIPASAQEIYEAWLDSLAHSEMTRGPAIMSDEVGAEVSAWDGYITGRNLELVPGERIVQSWRTTQFSDEHEDSTVTVMLEELEDGTLLTLVHSNVPDEQTSYEQGGWEEHYFEPMKEYFAERKRAGARKTPKAAAPKPGRAKASGKSKRVAKKARPAAGKKNKKKKAKRAAAAKAKAKRAKKAKSRTARGKTARKKRRR